VSVGAATVNVALEGGNEGLVVSGIAQVVAQPGNMLPTQMALVGPNVVFVYQEDVDAGEPLAWPEYDPAIRTKWGGYVQAGSAVLPASVPETDWSVVSRGLLEVIFSAIGGPADWALGAVEAYSEPSHLRAVSVGFVGGQFVATFGDDVSADIELTVLATVATAVGLGGTTLVQASRAG
jgi:hypothetical protein